MATTATYTPTRTVNDGRSPRSNPTTIGMPPDTTEVMDATGPKAPTTHRLVEHPETSDRAQSGAGAPREVAADDGSSGTEKGYSDKPDQAVRTGK